MKPWKRTNNSTTAAWMVGTSEFWSIPYVATTRRHSAAEAATKMAKASRSSDSLELLVRRLTKLENDCAQRAVSEARVAEL
eukprot:821887-Amphidinium_carterae.1